MTAQPKRNPSSPTTTLADYCNKLAHALKAGNATEHTHRPALKILIESLTTGVTAINEPQKIECGSPDFIITRRGIPLGYIEAKDVGSDLERIETTDQLKRYRASLRNLILTDYLAFRLYRNGDVVQSARLGRWQQKTGALRFEAGGAGDTDQLLRTFFDVPVPTIASPRELAERMARLARLLHDLIREVFVHEGTHGDLHGQFDAFRKILIADLSPDRFADMYAQTIAYGLFAARCNQPGPGFTRANAGKALPKTNPFLRRLFNTIAGVDLDDRIAWAVDDLADLLARADMPVIMADFGKATRREDAVVHFYETFLAAYNPQLREMRGVYYTPEPVVDYIVRSIDLLLRTRFELKNGLADKSKVKIELPADGKKKAKIVETHRVQILDPACGTGTFLHAVIAQIQERFLKAKGLWPGYVAAHLLPRVYGFELLMAPYAVAHMKLGLQLSESGYGFAADERLRVFLTNSLEEAHDFPGLPLFAQWLADEASAASEIKRDVPIMVVLGNPPYSGISSNRGDWIEELVAQYKKEPDGTPLMEQKHWLRDDYVKFIRFAQWRIEQTGHGVLGFISNHGYLDNPTFRGMRHSLMQSFDHIYVLDLHGNSKKGEKAPDGSKDENVFDIQQGVAICLMVRTGAKPSPARTVHHAELWGTRASKYARLTSQDVSTTDWTRLDPQPPFLFFYPRSTDFRAEYELYPGVRDMVRAMGLGLQSSRDDLVVGFSREEVEQRIEAFLDPAVSDDAIRERFFPGKQVGDYAPGDTRQWSLTAARAALRADPNWRDAIRPTLYRPFDVRHVLYDRRMVDWPRPEVLGHMLQDNIALLVNRQSKEDFAVLCSDMITERKIAAVYDASTTIPLYLYQVKGGLLTGRGPNLKPEFIRTVSERLGLRFVPDGAGDLQSTVGPQDVFAYLYAILHAPGYRARYATFLKTDFPRLPITSDARLFRSLAALGNELTALHLMKTTSASLPGYPVAGNNRVELMDFEGGRVHINASQYFDNVPEAAWQYRIGGYQVAHKWLKDRKGRLLTFDELQHYRRVIAALDDTIRIQGRIDAGIGTWPLP